MWLSDAVWYECRCMVERHRMVECRCMWLSDTVCEGSFYLIDRKFVKKSARRWATHSHEGLPIRKQPDCVSRKLCPFQPHIIQKISVFRPTGLFEWCLNSPAAKPEHSQEQCLLVFWQPGNFAVCFGVPLWHSRGFGKDPAE